MSGHNLPEARFWNNRYLFIAAVALIAVGSIYFLDLSIAEYFFKTSKGLKRLFKFESLLFDPKYHFTLWPVLFLIVAYLLKKKKLGTRLLLLVISLPVSVAVTDIIKFLAGRFRPNLYFTRGVYGFDFFGFENGEFSFPSAHGTIAGALAGSLSCFYPKYSIYFLIGAIFLAFGRVGMLQHYFSDILAGVTVGVLMSQWCYLKMEKSSKP